MTANHPTPQSVATTICLLFGTLTTCCSIGCGTTEDTPQANLARAIRKGDIKGAKQLAPNVDLSQPIRSNGDHALHVLAKSMQAKREIVKLLVEHGAKLDAKNAKGRDSWSLVWPAPPQNPSLTGRILDSWESGFLSELLKAGYTPSRDLPPKHEAAGESFLHLAARCSGSAELMMLLSKEQPIDAPDNNGWTPLHRAAYAGNYEAAEGLLEAGANPNAKTTKLVQDSYLKGETTVIRLRVEVGSHPLDLYHQGWTRFTKDFAALMQEHGGIANPDVNNRFP